uniref:Uncharacterized protein n=1 Tax=Tanacetum cinerariifolium TaxID=118510 RepID=A0A6L2KU70_TANCI|nr:hypothetical protein [Tanacetum cinerariifolium]
MMERDAEREEMYDQMRKFMQDINVGPVRQAKKGPIIVGKHYGLSDFSRFQSMQGFPHAGPSSIPTQANISFFEDVQATLSYGHNMAMPNWQTPMTSHPDTSNWQTHMPSRLANLNWKTPISSHSHVAGLFKPNILNQKRRKVRPSIYRRTPFMDLPPTTVLPKKRGKCETGNYFLYVNVDPSKSQPGTAEPKGLVVRGRVYAHKCWRKSLGHRDGERVLIEGRIIYIKAEFPMIILVIDIIWSIAKFPVTRVMYLKTIPSKGRIETGRVWMIKDCSNSKVIRRATRGSILKDIEFQRLQARDMLWTEPISNASVEAVQCETSTEFRAIEGRLRNSNHRKEDWTKMIGSMAYKFEFRAQQTNAIGN